MHDNLQLLYRIVPRVLVMTASQLRIPVFPLFPYHSFHLSMHDPFSQLLYQTYRERRESATSSSGNLDHSSDSLNDETTGVTRLQYHTFSPRVRERTVGFHMIRVCMVWFFSCLPVSGRGFCFFKCFWNNYFCTECGKYLNDEWHWCLWGFECEWLDAND